MDGGAAGDDDRRCVTTLDGGEERAMATPTVSGEGIEAIQIEISVGGCVMKM